MAAVLPGGVYAAPASSEAAGAALRVSPEMMAVLYSGAVVNCAQWWLTRGSRTPKEAVVAQFAGLLERG